MRIKVIDKDTKQPMKGVEIHVYTLYPKQKVLAKGVADSQGIVELFPEIEGEYEVELKKPSEEEN